MILKLDWGKKHLVISIKKKSKKQHAHKLTNFLVSIENNAD